MLDCIDMDASIERLYSLGDLLAGETCPSKSVASTDPFVCWKCFSACLSQPLIFTTTLHHPTSWYLITPCSALTL